MPLDTVPADEFMNHNGVPVYHVYRHDNMSDPLDCWFSLWDWGSDEDPHGINGCFDYRELPPFGDEEKENSDDKEEQQKYKQARIANAIDTGHFDDWDDSWK